MLVPILLFLLGFVLLIKGGDLFVDGAVGLAHRFHLPELLIGATVVSIGTTLPEVMVSSQAAFESNAGISYGNAIGSIICNTSLIAALTAAIRPGKVDPKTFRLPTLFFFLTAISYALVAWTAGRFSRWMGVAYLCVFVGYMILSVVQMKKHPELSEEDGEEEENAPQPLWKELLLLVVGAGAIALGGHGALSLGNVIGANLFNIVLVSGMAITISPFAVPAEKTIAGFNSSLIVDLPVMLAVMAILCLPPLRSGKIRRWQGVVLLCAYAAFTVYQFVS